MLRSGMSLAWQPWYESCAVGLDPQCRASSLCGEGLLAGTPWFPVNHLTWHLPVVTIILPSPHTGYAIHAHHVPPIFK